MSAVSVAPAGTDVRRPLSPLERWYWIADQLSPLNVISRVRLRGPLPADALRRGLDALQATHPLLRVAITGGRQPGFVPTAAPIPLREVTADRGADWEREVNEVELADRLDWRAGPLVRAVVVTQGDVHDLVLTVSHCIADGTTALSLLREWIELADGAPCPAGVVTAPPEDMFRARHRGARGALGAISAQLRDQLTALRRRPHRVSASQPVPFDERRTRFLHGSLSGAQLDALVEACRREGATVHGALAAAMVAAAARDAGTDGPFTIGSPVDFRGELVPPVSPREVGAYVATVPSFVDSGSPLWPAARAVSQDLTRRRVRGEHFAQINTLRWVCPSTLAASTPFVRRVEKQGPGNLCISNIGRYDFPDAVGAWQLSDAQFIAGISVSGYLVATVNTTHGRLFWNITYVDGIVPQARAAAMADAALDILLSAAHAVPQ